MIIPEDAPRGLRSLELSKLGFKNRNDLQVGGFEYFLFSTLPGEMIQFD